MVESGRMQTNVQSAAQSVPVTGGAAESAKDRLRKDLAGKSYEEQAAQLDPGADPAPGAGPTQQRDQSKAPSYRQIVTPRDYPGMEEALDQPPAATAMPPEVKAGGGGEGSKDSKAAGAGASGKLPSTTGIASRVSMSRFVTAAKQVEATWPDKTVEERAEALGDAAAAELTAIDVPPTTTEVQDLGSKSGQLDFKNWVLELNEKEYDKPAVSSGEMSGLANVAYHEARHGEQWHRMARILAGRRMTAQQIAAQMGIDEGVAEDAADKPLDEKGAEGMEGKAWYESVYGAKSAQRSAVLNALTTDGEALQRWAQKLTQAQQKLQALAADGTATAEERQAAQDAHDEADAEYLAAKVAFERTYAKYRALAEELDAWAAGDAVGAEYLE